MFISKHVNSVFPKKVYVGNINSSTQLAHTKGKEYNSPYTPYETEHQLQIRQKPSMDINRSATNKEIKRKSIETSKAEDSIMAVFNSSLSRFGKIRTKLRSQIEKKAFFSQAC